MYERNDRLLTVPEVAARLQVSVPTVRRWISVGHLPHVKLSPGRRNGCVRVANAELAAFIERGSQESRDE